MQGGGGGVKRPRADPVAQFVEQWGIDADAEQRLRSLPGELQDEVIASFHPPPNTVNFSGKLISFIRQRQQGGGDTGARSSPSQVQWHEPADPIGDFVSQWGLDSTSDGLLRSLEEDLLNDVLMNFQPQAGTRNPNAKLA